MENSVSSTSRSIPKDTSQGDYLCTSLIVREKLWTQGRQTVSLTAIASKTRGLIWIASQLLGCVRVRMFDDQCGVCSCCDGLTADYWSMASLDRGDNGASTTQPCDICFGPLRFSIRVFINLATLDPIPRFGKLFDDLWTRSSKHKQPFFVNPSKLINYSTNWQH